MNTYTRILLPLFCMMLFATGLLAQGVPSPLWVKAPTGAATEFVHKLVVDEFGNVYATGYYQGTVNFDVSQTGFTRSSQGSNDVFVAKYNAAGVCQWVRAFGGTGSDVGADIKLDRSGNVLVTGSYDSPGMVVDSPTIVGVARVGLRDIFVASFSNSGAYNWSISMGGSGEDIPTALVVDTSNNFYIAGLFYGTADFNPSGALSANLSSTSPTYDGFLAKYTSAGTYIFARKIGGNDVDAAYGLAINGSDVLVTGKFRQTVNFDPNGTYNVTVAGYEDGYLAAYTSTGALRFVFSVGGSTSTDIVAGTQLVLDDSSNVYVAGTFKGTIDFDPTGSTANRTATGNIDMFLARYNSNGTLAWVRNFPNTTTTANLDEIVNDLVLDNEGNILMTGLFYESVDFDAPNNTWLTSSYGSDIYLAKYAPVSGNHIWSFGFGGTNDGGYSIGLDTSNNIYLGGYFSAVSPPADFDPRSATLNLLSTNGNPDMFIAKYSQAGGSGCADTYVTMVINSCDEYTSPSGNYTWYTNGLYHDTIPNTGGCDSVITINLFLKYSISQNVFETFCQGGVYVAPDGATYSSPGNYTAVIQASNGCDSIINIDLTEAMPDATVSQSNDTLTATTTNPATYEWVDCNNGNTPINGATSATFIPAANGSYGLNITQDGCTAFSGCYNVTTVGADVLHAEDGMKVYPNPGTALVTVELGRPAEVKVYDLMGNLVLTAPAATRQTLDMNPLAQGVYFVKADGNIIRFIRQ